MSNQAGAARLRADGVRLAYDDLTVVDGLSLEIPDGKVTVIVGPNACGKSTLLRALARLLRPTAGTVILDGEQIHRLPTKEVAKRLGLLPQTPIAPEGILVVDLVSRGRTPHQKLFQQWSEADERAVRSALEATSSMDLAERPVDELSGGQRQRVWIAMALAQQTDLLLLDEPTTFLDIAHQIDVLDLVERLNCEEGRTVVLVLHDLNLACRYADHIVAMCDGAIVAAGDPAAVITADNVRAVFGLDCMVIDDPVSGTPLVVPIGSRHAPAEGGVERSTPESTGAPVTFRTAQMVAVIVVVGVATAGCGGDDDTRPGTAAVTSQAQAASSASDPTNDESGSTPDTAVDPLSGSTTMPSTGPRIVEHQYGSTEVPIDPRRIVALSEEFLLADLLALGVVPIASTSNDATAFVGIDPADTAGIDVIASVDFNVERLAALSPDLILAYPEYIDLVGYDLLNAIAPTVAIGDAGSDWRDQLRLTAEALGLDQLGTDRVTEIESLLTDAREMLAGTEMSVLSISPGPFLRAYTDDRTDITATMADLGVIFVPDSSGSTDDNGRIEVSLEQLGILDAKILLLLQSTVIEGEDEAVSQVEQSPLWSSLPAVAAGNVITLDRLAYPGALGVGRFATDLAAEATAVIDGE